MLRARLFLLVFIPLTFMLALSAIVFTFFDPTGRSYHVHATIWGRIGLWLAGVKLRVTGLEKVPVDGPVVFMSNHQGNFDILALCYAIPRQFSWIAKEELFAIPVLALGVSR